MSLDFHNFPCTRFHIKTRNWPRVRTCTFGFPYWADEHSIIVATSGNDVFVSYSFQGSNESVWRCWFRLWLKHAKSHYRGNCWRWSLDTHIRHRRPMITGATLDAWTRVNASSSMAAARKARVARQRTLIVIRYIPCAFVGKMHPVV